MGPSPETHADASPGARSAPHQVLGPQEAERTLKRLAHEVIEARKGAGAGNLVLVGIRSGGDHLARELAGLIARIEGMATAPPVGYLDITLYRDDLGAAPTQPVVRETRVEFNITGRDVLLVDDVLQTGRTIRAALNALMDFGRPARVLLAVLVDRGHRELPIRPDFVGKNIPTEAGDRVEVHFTPDDRLEGVRLYRTTDLGATR
jgi:pyrimidine operon attenuation protein / uracil phosphoribosyltransferase